LRRLFAIALAIAFAVYCAYVAVANREVARLDLVFAALEQPLWILLGSALLLGAALAAAALSWPYLRLRLAVRRQSRRITRLEQEVHGLRTLPLGEQDPAAGASARK
jgi:uncharacterized membrane protein YciS (DUF1049 family)